MSNLTEYELERQANIARNRALLESLDIQNVAEGLKSKKREQKARPVQPAKRVKVEKILVPTRQSARLRRIVELPDESPSKKRKRLEMEEKLRRQQENERLAAEERVREAKKPRHEELDLIQLTKTAEMEDDERNQLSLALQEIARNSHPRKVAGHSDFDYEDEKKEKVEVEHLRKQLQRMRVVSRAKVCDNRIYSSAYHPEKTKDLIFFGDKHGQLGIWDARADPDEINDDDDQTDDTREGGKHWKLQPHWPATSKSSLSAIRFDPRDAQRVFTSAYDSTIRNTSFESGTSSEVFSTDALISSFDMPPVGQELWVSDAEGGVSHIDLREDKSKARRWRLSSSKIGCVSVNPMHPEKLLCSSNDRTLKIWDARKLLDMPIGPLFFDAQPPTYDFETMEEFVQQTSKGKHATVATWEHGKSVSAAYWDPRGRGIVSTSYDDQLRVWDLGSMLEKDGLLPSFRPVSHIPHNNQTGRWVTIFKAQWSSNPDVYPHFTIGNMKHSLDIYTCKGELLCQLSDQERISAVQAVTCSHPGIVERAASGNATGRCVLWAPIEDSA